MEWPRRVGFELGSYDWRRFTAARLVWRRHELGIDHQVVSPVELGTDVTGIREVLGNVIKLVTRQCQLKPRKRNEREPGGTADRILN